MKTVEIERKFLIDKDKFFEYLSNCPIWGKNHIQIIQFYIHIDDEKEVRVRFTKSDHRVCENSGYIFIKYHNNDDLLSRMEFSTIMDKYTREEYYKYMIDNDINRIIKNRYGILYKGVFFEVDIFCGDNEGLCIAEVELFNKNDNIELPDFILKEVTGDTKYYNKNLYINPYKNWKE